MNGRFSFNSFATTFKIYMMKKIILLLTGLCFAFAGFAQKANVQSASNYLKDKDYSKALEYIEKAATNESTKDEPRTWFVKAGIYASMNEDPKMKGKGYYREAIKAAMKAQELKPGYEKEVINQLLLSGAYAYYNDLAAAFNNKSYNDAFDYAQAIGQIHDLDGGKRFNNKGFDTIASLATFYGAYAAYNNNKYSDAMPLLEKLKSDPISRNENVFWFLANIYKIQNDNNKYIATIEEGRKMFPNSVNLKNEEINYYIQTGQQDIYMKKLKEAFDSDPNNADYAYNMANGFNGMAFPKDAEGKDLPPPANYDEMVAKAEEAYQLTVKLSPNNIDYNYNTGAHFFNRGTVVNEKIKNLGNSAADMKKYDELKVKRDQLFVQSLPYFEKVVSLQEGKIATMSKDDRFTYQSALLAMRQIYAIQNNLEKVAEMKKKQEALK
jgi:hypothetical protein